MLTDGAMGTMLYEAGTPLDDCFDALNLSAPAAVAAVHRAYLEAGADIIETNTFGANRFRLEGFGLANKVREINRKGVRLARDAREIAGVSALVAGSIGPTARTLAPIGMTDPGDVQAVFQEQIEALFEAGVDLLVIETIGNLDEMVAAITAAKAISDLPIVANMTFAEDGRTIGDNSPEEVVDRLAPLGVTTIGANCSVGPQRLLPVMAAMARRLEQMPGERLWLSCLPNAGWPAHVAGRVIYP
ncbi:MAG: homocysteine S-methyltransferase family protein, partial [Dehalococcoidia bacterium]